MDDTVQSRCCLLNVPQSPDSDIIEWIQTISNNEQIQLSKDEISNVIKNSDYNLNKILIYLFGIKSNISIPLNNKEIIDDIYKLIHKKNISFTEIREIAYFISSFDINIEEVLQYLVYIIMMKLPVKNHLKALEIVTSNSSEIQISTRQSINYEKLIIDLACFIKA